MKVAERVAALRKCMAEKQMDAYMVPAADNHQSENVGEHFKARTYISGFTGSAGTVVITKDDAGLWTDGRYFIQAETQLAGSGVRLFKIGEPGVPTPEEYLTEVLPEGAKLGFDGRVIAVGEGQDLELVIRGKNGSIDYSCDLINDIWTDRPELSDKPAFLLEEKYAGESSVSKVARVREKMQELGATIHVISSLDDVAWLLNIRGDDVAYAPLVLSYAIVTMNDVHVFMDERKLNDVILAEFKKINVVLHPYDDIYEYVKGFQARDTILIDPRKLNYALYNNISQEVTTIEAPNPTILFKAIKNDVEIENFKKSHIKDGIAFTKFMYWLKTNVGKIDITEISASDKLEEFRAEQEGFLWPSFAPISAYKEHAAMMHYSATKDTDVPLLAEHLYLTDTGGNYYEGTTDITRTMVLGEISDQLKLHFTAVVRGMMNLSMAKFLQGAIGYNLDILARKPMWDLGLDFKCGTGHGVGYLLNIHEAPTGFRWLTNPLRDENHPFEAGMIITNEPGIYIEGSHGIRIENEMITRMDEKTEFGQFMSFEPCTFVPIDLDGIEPTLLNQEEKNYLNNYHKMVFQTIAPHLTEEEREWLKVYTREV
ncbi:MAG: aminopeptidase P family protein [Lachnospiraceae bacterium]